MPADYATDLNAYEAAPEGKIAPCMKHRFMNPLSPMHPQPVAVTIAFLITASTLYPVTAPALTEAPFSQAIKNKTINETKRTVFGLFSLYIKN